MLKLPSIKSKKKLKGKKILLRVDWNISLKKKQDYTKFDFEKIKNSVQTINFLKKQGAIVIILTHWGRPQKRQKELSLKNILNYAELILDDDILFLGNDITKDEDLILLKKEIDSLKDGTLVLLENVRFYKGEIDNDKKLSQCYASIADIYVNDAFASSHRKHVSVTGLANFLPHYAGFSLIEEVKAIDKAIVKPKKPLMVILGGLKISTKIGVISSLLPKANKIFIGGAMANTFFVAQRKKIGKSVYEKDGLKLARKLLKNKKIVLPSDVLVAKKISSKEVAQTRSLKFVKSGEMIVDIGPGTMQDWAKQLKKAGTIIWNGPLGVAQFINFAQGSLFMAREIGFLSEKGSYGIVGGGDTLPLILKAKVCDSVTHVSMGGGALLEYIAFKGRLPGLLALSKSQIKFKKK